MIDVSKYLLDCRATVLDALRGLNSLSGAGMTLFVIDDEQVVKGTLTDGDIRRCFLHGGQLSDRVENVMNKNFSALRFEDANPVECCRKFRNKGINVIPVLDAKGHVADVLDLHKQCSLLPVDAVIMAGGKGERLRPLTLTIPKPLLKVGDKAIIDTNVDRLIWYGVKHIAVTVNYLKDQLIDHFSLPRNGVEVKCYSECDYMGTMGAVKMVDQFHNDTILVMNSDLYTNIDYEDMYLCFCHSGADMLVAAVPYVVSIPFGICDLDDDEIKGIVEKPTYNYYANAGIYMMKRDVLNLIPQGRFYNATDLISDLILAKKKVIRYPLNGTWIDIGTKEDYHKAQDLAKQG